MQRYISGVEGEDGVRRSISGAMALKKGGSCHTPTMEAGPVVSLAQAAKQAEIQLNQGKAGLPGLQESVMGASTATPGGDWSRKVTPATNADESVGDRNLRFQCPQRLNTSDSIPAPEPEEEISPAKPPVLPAAAVGKEELEEGMMPPSADDPETPREKIVPIFKARSEPMLRRRGRTMQDFDSPRADGSAAGRTPKRRFRRVLTVVETMGISPSSALQIVINNPGQLESFYDVDQVKSLGKGSFGVVRRATVKSTGAVRAVKSIAKAKMKERMDVLKLEIEICKMVDHPNCVMLFEIFEDNANLYLVMELCNGGCLQTRVKQLRRLTETQAACCFQQILRGVYYLHKHLICHRDLKAENVLVQSADPLERNLMKISDFGLSCNFKPGEYMVSRVGTQSHMAPEVLDRKYTHSCDIWSCGVILYFLMSGRTPFNSEAETKRGTVSFGTAEWWEASQELVDIVNSLLSPAARKVKPRPSAEGALKDPWFKKTVLKKEEIPLKKSVVNDLKYFHSLNKLKRAALTTVASMLAEADISAIRETFINLDNDGDGCLSVEELEMRVLADNKGKKKEKGEPPAENEVTIKDIKGAFEDASKPKCKDISYTEFLAATFDRQRCLTDEVCRAAFNSFDKNKDGTIDIEELCSGQILGILEVAELEALLEDFDQDGDGTIDFAEFCEMLRGC